MISVRLNGRLGNQLFQYAFAYTAAKQLKTSFYIDQYNEKFIAGKYFKNLTPKGSTFIINLFGITGFKNFFSFYLCRFYYDYVAKLYKLSTEKYDFNVPLTAITLRDSVLYEGYFQSQLFFKSAENSIRNKFTLKKKITEQFRLKYGLLYQNNSIVTVHIRRTDYQDLRHLNLGGDDLSLPLKYYKKAIANYDGQNIHFVFISDELDFVKQHFEEISNKTIAAETEIMDFQHLLNADGCIISNSTFSWWGAWLNNKPDKIIYAPKYFMGWRIKKETPWEIYPKEWIQIDF